MSNVMEDLGGDNNADGVEERMKAGGLIPVGFHRAILNGANDTESKEKGTPGYVLQFLITAGPAEGMDLTERVWKRGKDDKATARCRDRIKLFGHRLGVLTKSADGKAYLPVEGVHGFEDRIDTECVIEVVHEPDQDNKAKMWARLAWAGVYTPTDPEAVAALANGGKRPDKPAAGTANRTSTNGRAASPPPPPAAPPPPPAAPGRARTRADQL